MEVRNTVREDAKEMEKKYNKNFKLKKSELPVCSCRHSKSSACARSM
jgi:hypothetical protein